MRDPAGGQLRYSAHPFRRGNRPPEQYKGECRDAADGELRRQRKFHGEALSSRILPTAVSLWLPGRLSILPTQAFNCRGRFLTSNT